MSESVLRVGIAGLGAVGLEVARRIDAGIQGLALTAVSARDHDKAREKLAGLRTQPEIVSVPELAEICDVIVEGLPPSAFLSVAEPAIERGRVFMPLSVGQLLVHAHLVDRAAATGARILVPTGALIGLDAVRAAAEGNIRSVTMITRKPPGGLEGAPYLVERGISLKGLNDAKKVFDGSARDGAKGFPANVNVAAALSLAGIGPDRTRLEIWADPAVDRNTHRIEVDADTARFSMSIENVPSVENPRTGKITALSAVAALRGLVATLKVGT
jgi:aspartate dehydrogenase